MVRRWSYINNVNGFNPSSFHLTKKASFDNVMNTTMYLRKNYALSTILTRRRWSRRKHIHNWLPLANVVKDWARTYRFYRTYNKFVFNQHLTRHSFIGFSLISARNSIPCLSRGSEDLIVSPITRKVLNYFKSYLNPRLRFFRSMKYTPIALVSYNPKYIDFNELQSYASVIPLLEDNIDKAELVTFTDKHELGATLATLTQLFNVSFRMWLENLKCVYKTCVLLTYYKLL